MSKVIITNTRGSSITIGNGVTFKSGKNEVELKDFLGYSNSAGYQLFAKPGFLVVDAKSVAAAQAEAKKHKSSTGVDAKDTHLADAKAAKDKAAADAKAKQQGQKYVLDNTATVETTKAKSHGGALGDATKQAGQVHQHQTGESLSDFSAVKHPVEAAKK